MRNIFFCGAQLISQKLFTVSKAPPACEILACLLKSCMPGIPETWLHTPFLPCQSLHSVRSSYHQCARARSAPCNRIVAQWTSPCASSASLGHEYPLANVKITLQTDLLLLCLSMSLYNTRNILSNKGIRSSRPALVIQKFEANLHYKKLRKKNHYLNNFLHNKCSVRKVSKLIYSWFTCSFS